MTTPSHPPESQEEAWGPCARGELVALHRRLRASGARGMQTGVAAGVLFGAAALIAMVSWPAAEAQTHRLTCRECMKLLPVYHDKLVGAHPHGDHAAPAAELPDEEAEAVTKHLNACPPCRNRYEQNYADGGGGKTAAIESLAVAAAGRRG